MSGPPTPYTIDPALFDPAAIDPLTRQVNEMLEKALAAAPTILDTPAQVIREARIAGKSFLGPIKKLPDAVDREIVGRSGTLVLRVFRAMPSRGAFLHIHGGGWAFGAHDQQDLTLAAVANATGLSAVSVGYRLAPEHPYPAAADDCEKAALWLAENVAREFGGAVLAIGGESAGAHLSVLTLLRLRDRHKLLPFSAATLWYGGYDLTLTPSTRAWGARNLVLSTPIIERYADWFVPARELRAEPEVSPLYADLRGLPPALFTVGTLDPLLDDTLFMASRWSAAGNRAELEIAPGGVHAFNAMPTAIAARANARAMAFLARETGSTPK